jgi:hypothetical protein
MVRICSHFRFWVNSFRRIALFRAEITAFLGWSLRGQFLKNESISWHKDIITLKPITSAALKQGRSWFFHIKCFPFRKLGTILDYKRVKWTASACKKSLSSLSKYFGALEYWPPKNTGIFNGLLKDVRASINSIVQWGNSNVTIIKYRTTLFLHHIICYICHYCIEGILWLRVENERLLLL